MDTWYNFKESKKNDNMSFQSMWIQYNNMIDEQYREAQYVNYYNSGGRHRLVNNNIVRNDENEPIVNNDGENVTF